MGMLSDFRTFITKGNVIDLAVAFVIGAAFSAVVTALVNDIIMPLISIPGSQNLSGYSYKIGGGTFLYGAFITQLITFVLIAAAVYFIIVRPIAQMEARRAARQPKADPTDRECPYCLSKVPIKATKCAFCTSSLPPA